MAYDIECDSSHGDFPIPKKDYLKLAREIYNDYMKYDTMKKKILETTGKIDKTKLEEVNSIIENKEEFVQSRINAAFNDSDNSLEISKVFTKSGRSPKSADIIKAAEMVSKYLVIGNQTNSIEKKRHFTRCINNMNLMLGRHLKESVEGDHAIQIGISFLRYGSKVPYKNSIDS